MTGRILCLMALCLCIALQTHAQQKITGKIISGETNEALPGVNILIKDTSRGTTSDTSGNYSLEASENDVLVFSFIGFLQEEIVVGSSSLVNIRMTPDITQLEDIIVVGYGTQRKSDITGALSSVKPREFEQLPIARVDQALQGRIPGVLVQNTDAAPNASTTIRVRGYSSINAGNNPLIVIDGMQGGSLNMLNTSDVESVEVLKDASATAIYGSRGASGVILINTKKGKTNSAPAVSYNSFFSLSQLRKKLDLMSAQQYANTVNENRTEAGLPPVFTEAEVSAFAKNGTDWQDAIFRKGYTQNHTIGLTGGSENLTYYIGGNILGQTGIIENSSYSRYSLRSNLRTNISKRLSLGLNMFLIHETDHPVTLNTFAGENSGSPVYSALLWSPTKAVYENGQYTKPGGGAGPKTNYNPVALALEPIRDYYTNASNLVANIEYELLKGMEITIMGSYNGSVVENNEYINSKPSGNIGTEIANVENRKSAAYLNTNMLTYEKKFNAHNLKITTLFEQQYEEASGNYSGSAGFFTDGTTYNNLGIGQNPKPLYSGRTSRSLLSYMARVNYGLNDRYLITLTARADGSSVFGKDNKWGFFPSVALGWNISNESFMDSFENTISNLKLRGSYGVVGNQAIPAYTSLATLNTNAQYLLDGNILHPGASFSQAPNPDLKWESTRQMNIGLDAELFDGRVEVTADYYIKNTTDLLFEVALPKLTGYRTQWRNVGEVENKGFELYLGGKPLVGGFKWEMGFTLGINKNKVISLAAGADDQPVDEFMKSGVIALPGFANSFWLEAGRPIAVFRGYIYEGVWKSSEATEAAKYDAFPGAPKYSDTDSDGDIDADDFVTIGNAIPDFSYGWNNNLSFRNFDLNIFIQGVQGGEIYNLSRLRMETSSGDSDATSVKILHRWTPQNENTDVPSFTGSTIENTNSSRWIEDASYLRIKNIALGYRLPAPVLDVLKISACRIYVSGTNLFTWSDYSGFDPETSAQTDALAGVDLATYPSQRIYSLGLDIKF